MILIYKNKLNSTFERLVYWIDFEIIHVNSLLIINLDLHVRKSNRIGLFFFLLTFYYFFCIWILSGFQYIYLKS